MGWQTNWVRSKNQTKIGVVKSRVVESPVEQEVSAASRDVEPKSPSPDDSDKAVNADEPLWGKRKQLTHEHLVPSALQNIPSEHRAQAAAMLLPGVRRMHDDAAPEDKGQLAQEIKTLEMELGIYEAEGPDIDDNLQLHIPGEDKATTEAMRKKSAEMLLPALIRMRGDGSGEDKKELQEQIENLKKELNIVEDVSSPTVLVGRKLSPGEDSQTKAQKFLLNGLRRMHDDATPEEKVSIAQEILALEEKLGLERPVADVDFNVIPPSRQKKQATEDISKHTAALLLPGLRRMYDSASAEEKPEIFKNISGLERQLGEEVHIESPIHLHHHCLDKPDEEEKKKETEKTDGSDVLNTTATNSSAGQQRSNALLLAALRRMYEDASSEERARLVKEIASLEAKIEAEGRH